tara:strand:+ start:393 stop:920 length:528 start_codon:yes stop_codon:yes gene_type:complete
VENSRSDILLIGMPMSGKSTIGKALSEKIKYAFNDMDSIIEDRYKQTVSNIFETLGEEQYRLYEIECLRDLSGRDKFILSTGGGTINDKSIEISLSFKYRIWLQASIDELIKRYLDEEEKRPLLYNTNNIKSFLTDMYSSREFFYMNCSNIVVNTTSRTIDQITNELIRKINELD